MPEEEYPDSNPEKKHRRRRRRRRSSSTRHRHYENTVQYDADVPRWKINFVKGFFIFNGIIGILIPWAYTFYMKNF